MYAMLLFFCGILFASSTIAVQNDSHIVFGATIKGETEIWLINADGTNLTNLTGDLDRPAGQAAWSPDGTQFVFTVDSFNARRKDIWLMNADGTNKRPVAEQPIRDDDITRLFNSPTWAQDGGRIAFNQTMPFGEVYILDLVEGELQPWVGVYYPIIRWSPDGGAFVVQTSSAEIAIVDTDGTNERILTESLGFGRKFLPRWSPDSQRIVFYSEDRNVWIIDRDGQHPINVTSHIEGEFRDPSWSPDGTSLAMVGFLTSESSVNNLWTINIDGTGLTQVTFLEEASNNFLANPVWQPSSIDPTAVQPTSWGTLKSGHRPASK